MSGPVDDTVVASEGRGVSAIEVREGRTTTIGKLGIVRVLPAKGRRAIGPWCFVDLMTPGDMEAPPPIEIGPHPHIGLATVTWLFEGSALHSDSLGSEQLIRPGQVNLMTAGHGIAHAELGVEMSSAASTNGHMGVQMWLAQPEATRHGVSSFQHVADLPVAGLGTGEATVMVGALGGQVSGAVFEHPTVGLDVTFRQRVVVPVDPSFEHAVVPIGDALKVDDAIVEPGSIADVPSGYDELVIETRGGTSRFLLLGGEPLGAPIKMWWNFVARTLDEITDAWRAWQEHDEDRFGPVPSSLARIDAPAPPWLTPG
jgi:redox-sensitive bicupin YhaK (pirin superfamily)